MADSPWGFWQMQEASGATSITDSAGGHGGIYGAPSVSVAGPYSGWAAARFSTSAAQVNGVRAQNTPLAIEMWTKATSVAAAAVAFSYEDASRATGFELGAWQVAGCGPNAALNVNCCPNVGWFCSNHVAFTNTAWRYAVMQFEADGHWRLYTMSEGYSAINVDDFGGYTFGTVSSPNLYIGRHAPGTAIFTGDIAAVAFYDHQLTLSRIQAHWDARNVVIPPAPCVSRIKAGLPAVQYLNDAAVQAVLAIVPGLSWALQLLSPFLGSALDLDLICAETPEALATPPTSWLTSAPPLLPFTYLKALMWPLWCECTPATPTPVPPSQTWTKPTDWPDTQIYVVNATNPCLDITEVRRKLDEVLRLVYGDLVLDTQMQRQLIPVNTVRGATHTGLTGSGTIDVALAIGVQVVILERPAGGRELEGAPNYVWDLGWASIMDPNGFIEERRITRDVEVWMPRLMSEANIFGYTFKDGVVGEVTILYPVT